MEPESDFEVLERAAFAPTSGLCFCQLLEWLWRQDFDVQPKDLVLWTKDDLELLYWQVNCQ